MKIYVVCEDYTCAFFGVFKNLEDAEAMAEEIGGYVEECEVE